MKKHVQYIVDLLVLGGYSLFLVGFLLFVLYGLLMWLYDVPFFE